MKLTYKIIAGVAASLSLAAAGVVYANPGMGMGMGMGQGMNMGMGHGMAGAMGGGMGMAGGMSGIDVGAMAATRLADLKAELKITPTQEAAWLTFENQAKQQAAAMQTMRSQMHNQQAGTTSTDFAAQRDAMIKLHDGNQAARDAALKDLYAVLTPEQKAIADQRLNAMGGHRTARNYRAN